MPFLTICWHCHCVAFLQPSRVPVVTVFEPLILGSFVTCDAIMLFTSHNCIQTLDINIFHYLSTNCFTPAGHSDTTILPCFQPPHVPVTAVFKPMILGPFVTCSTNFTATAGHGDAIMSCTSRSCIQTFDIKIFGYLLYQLHYQCWP